MSGTPGEFGGPFDCPTCGHVHPKGCRGHRSSDGVACTNAPIKGTKVCRFHGAGAPHVRKAAAAAHQEHEAEIVMAKVAEAAQRHAVPRGIDPKDGLLEVIGRLAGLVDLYEFNLNLINEEDLAWGTTQETRTKGQAMNPKGEVVDVDQTVTVKAAVPNVWLKLYEDALTKFARVCKDAASLGIEERRIELAERDGQLMAKVFRRWAQLMKIDMTDPAVLANFRQAVTEMQALPPGLIT